MIHGGVDIDGYAEGVATLARWPDARAQVLRRLCISEERWEACAAGFREAMVAEARTGRDDLTRRFRARVEMVRARLADPRTDLNALSPLPMAAPRLPPTPLGSNEDATAALDAGIVAQAIAAAERALPRAGAAAASTPESGQSARPSSGSLGSTVQMNEGQPHVPSAVPFSAATDEQVEAWAEVTAGLVAFPDRREDVLAKHGLDAVSVERARRKWALLFDKDQRLKMHWEGLHASFLGYIERQRAKGKQPCP